MSLIIWKLLGTIPKDSTSGRTVCCRSLAAPFSFVPWCSFQNVDFLKERTPPMNAAEGPGVVSGKSHILERALPNLHNRWSPFSLSLDEIVQRVAKQLYARHALIAGEVLVYRSGISVPVRVSICNHDPALGQIGE